MIFYDKKYKPKVKQSNQSMFFGSKFVSKPLLVIYQDVIYEATYYEERDVSNIDVRYYMIKQIKKEVKVFSDDIQKWTLKPKIEDYKR